MKLFDHKDEVLYVQKGKIEATVADEQATDYLRREAQGSQSHIIITLIVICCILYGLELPSTRSLAEARLGRAGSQLLY